MRHLQAGTSISALTGALFNSRGATSPVEANACQPGTHIVLRGGTWTDTAFEGHWARLMRITGTAPNGSSGQGPIVITSYPGAAGANAPELASWEGPDNTRGGIQGNDTARSDETNPYGGTGYCKYIHISNLKITPAPHNVATDAAPINLQTEGDYWRVCNNELVWRSTDTGVSHAKAAGITGHGLNNLYAGNYVHDIYGDPASNENHGIYLDGNVLCSVNPIVIFNCIRNVTAGNGIQQYGGNGDHADNLAIHHNWVETVNKHCLNLADQTKTAHAYSNVMLDAGECLVQVQTALTTSTGDIKVEYNTCHGFARVNGVRPAIRSTQDPGSGTAKFQNNIVTQASGRSGGYSYFSPDQTDFTCSNNRWYDFSLNLTAKPSQDSAGTHGTPTYNGVAVKNFSIASGSACAAAGTTALASIGGFDWAMKARPGTPSIGAMETQ